MPIRFGRLLEQQPDWVWATVESMHRRRRCRRRRRIRHATRDSATAAANEYLARPWPSTATPRSTRAYRWNVPAHFNIAQACCGRWADDRARFALYWEDESGATAALTFWDLQQRGQPPVQRARGARRRARRQGRAHPAAAAAKRSSRTSRSTRWARSRCRCRSCSVPTRSSTGSTIPSAKVAIVDPQSLPNLAPIRDGCPASRT